jgi:hypothetical protein
MATPQDALNYAKRMCGNMPVDDSNLNPRVLDDANKALWMAADWRWTIAPLEVLTIANAQQDYPLASHPDLLFLVHSSITDGEQKSDLIVTANLPSTPTNPPIVGKVQRVSYVPGVAGTPGTPQKLRTFPVPSGYPTSAMPSMFTWYKQLAPTIVGTNVTTDYTALTQTTGGSGTNVGFPAEFFWIYREMVLLYAYQFTHDARLGSVAGETSTDPKTGQQIYNVKYSGQYAVVQDGIQQMKMAEKRFFDSIGQEVTL